jgi:hypothetical protein
MTTLINDLNVFVDEHLVFLPDHVGVNSTYHDNDQHKRQYWLALILSFNDRYGSGKIINQRLFRLPSTAHQLYVPSINRIPNAVVARQQRVRPNVS